MHLDLFQETATKRIKKSAFIRVPSIPPKRWNKRLVPQERGEKR